MGPRLCCWFERAGQKPEKGAVLVRPGRPEGASKAVSAWPTPPREIKIECR